jgi:regulator of sigma D
MLDDCKDSGEAWQTVEGLLQGWLKERRDLLVKYTAIAATLDRASPISQINAGIERLCQLLVDYVSAGHFEVYYALQREAEVFGDGTESIAREIIPRISDTTEVILGFEEKYPTDVIDDMEVDLSLLGEILESRFDLEDKLIAALHRSHAMQQPAS